MVCKGINDRIGFVLAELSGSGWFCQLLKASLLMINIWGGLASFRNFRGSRDGVWGWKVAMGHIGGRPKLRDSAPQQLDSWRRISRPSFPNIENFGAEISAPNCQVGNRAFGTIPMILLTIERRSLWYIELGQVGFVS